MKWICHSFMLLYITSTITTSAVETVPAQIKQPKQPLITFCDLVASAGTYHNKEVRLVAIYRYGFEWQEIYSFSCADAPNTWLAWSNDYEACSERAAIKRLKKCPDGGATLGLVVRGKLTGIEGSYGHMNGYQLQFEVTCLEDVELLDKKDNHRHALTPEMRRKIEAFESKHKTANGVYQSRAAEPPKRILHSCSECSAAAR